MNNLFGGGCDCILWILILSCCCGGSMPNFGGGSGGCLCDVLPLLLILNCCCGGTGSSCGC